MAGRTTNRRRGHSGGGEHENSERWLLTYADMMTLLVAFFIMLYAMSVLNQQKFQQLAVSVRSGFGGSITTGAPTVISQGGGITGAPSIVSNSKQTDPDDTSLKRKAFGSLPKDAEMQRDAQRLDRAQEIMQAYIKQHHLENVMRVNQDERGVIVTVLTDKMLFAAGAADLEAGEMGLLDQIAHVINTVPNQVRVEGHTDSLPIHTARFPSNWELSAVRATTVLRYFAGQGVAAERLQAAAYADQRPMAPNKTDADRARNRRVEIVILRES